MGGGRGPKRVRNPKRRGLRKQESDVLGRVALAARGQETMLAVTSSCNVFLDEGGRLETRPG